MFVVKTLNPLTNLFIVRIARDLQDVIDTSIALVTIVKKKRAIIRVLHKSGMVFFWSKLKLRVRYNSICSKIGNWASSTSNTAIFIKMQNSSRTRTIYYSSSWVNLWCQFFTEVMKRSPSKWTSSEYVFLRNRTVSSIAHWIAVS